MYKETRLPSGVGMRLIVPRAAEERLKDTCFRGKAHTRAGNFFSWNSARELFGDKTVLDLFSDYIDELWCAGDFGTQSLCITLSEQHGWESTTPIECVDQVVLTAFNPNRRSTALKVSDRGLPAPKTNELTLVFDLKDDAGVPVVIISSIYPGTDIGELEGDITEREGRVFFDWDHPGAP